MPTDPKDDLLRLEPYLEDMDVAVRSAGEGAPRDGMAITVPLLAAIALRETWAGWAPGYYPPGDPDGGGDDPDGEAGPKPAWGRGLFQIDRRGPYGKLIPPVGSPWPVLAQAAAAVTALRDARRELGGFRWHPMFERACLCAYNAGSPAVARALRAGRDPDTVTAAGPSKRPDYGSDVQIRRARLLSQYPHVFAPPGADRSIA